MEESRGEDFDVCLDDLEHLDEHELENVVHNQRKISIMPNNTFKFGLYLEAHKTQLSEFRNMVSKDSEAEKEKEKQKRKYSWNTTMKQASLRAEILMPAKKDDDAQNDSSSDDEAETKDVSQRRVRQSFARIMRRRAEDDDDHPVRGKDTLQQVKEQIAKDNAHKKALQAKLAQSKLDDSKDAIQEVEEKLKSLDKDLEQLEVIEAMEASRRKQEKRASKAVEVEGGDGAGDEAESGSPDTMRESQQDRVDKFFQGRQMARKAEVVGRYLAAATIAAAAARWKQRFYRKLHAVQMIQAWWRESGGTVSAKWAAAKAARMAKTSAIRSKEACQRAREYFNAAALHRVHCMAMQRPAEQQGVHQQRGPRSYSRAAPALLDTRSNAALRSLRTGPMQGTAINFRSSAYANVSGCSSSFSDTDTELSQPARRRVYKVQQLNSSHSAHLYSISKLATVISSSSSSSGSGSSESRLSRPTTTPANFTRSHSLTMSLLQAKSHMNLPLRGLGLRSDLEDLAPLGTRPPLKLSPADSLPIIHSSTAVTPTRSKS